MTYYLLHIWTREDYGETAPTLTLVAKSKEALQRKFFNYLSAKIDEEDYMDVMEKADTLVRSNEIMEDKGPELNAAYILLQATAEDIY